jgi:hypothetical protein
MPKRRKLNIPFDHITQTQDVVPVKESPSFDLLQALVVLRSGNKPLKDYSKADNIPTQDSSLSDRLEALSQDLAQKIVSLRNQVNPSWRNKK